MPWLLAKIIRGVGQFSKDILGDVEERGVDCEQNVWARIWWDGRCEMLKGKLVIVEDMVVLVEPLSHGVHEQAPVAVAGLLRLHFFDGDKLDVPVRLAGAAVFAGVEECKESHLLMTPFLLC